MTIGLTTLAVIAIGLARAPTKLDGWMGEQHSVAEKYAPATEDEGLGRQGAFPTSSGGYASAFMSMDKASWLQAEIESYRHLPAGWDGEGSVGPSSDALEGARKLIDNLPAGLELPKPMITSSGELGFYWKADAYYADLIIEEKNLFSLFVRSREHPGREFYFDALPIAENGIAKLRDTLEQI